LHIIRALKEQVEAMKLNIKMSVEQRLLYTVFFVLMLGLALVVTVFYVFEMQSLQRIERIQREKIQDSYRKNIEAHLKENYSQVLAIFDDNEIRQALARQDRDALLNLTEHTFHKALQKDPYFKLVHYHLPSGFSFLRLNQPEQFGDHIAARRPYIASVHARQQAIFGFESGDEGVPLYRIIKPLFLQDEYIGAVEVAASPQKVVDLVSGFNGVEGVLTFFDTPPMLFENMSNRALFALYQRSLAENIPLASSVKSAGLLFQFYRFPVRDFFSQPIGEFVFFYDFSSFYKGFYNTLGLMIGASLAIFLLIFLLVKILVARYEQVLRDINARNQCILDAQSDIVIVTSGKRIVDVNQRFMSKLGFDSLAQFLQSHQCVCELFEAGDGLVTTYIDGLIWTDYLLRHSDKENLAKIFRGDKVFIFRLHAQQLNDKEVVITMQDISDLKKTERQLREYLDMIDRNLLISSTDLDGKITYVSKAFVATSGYQPDELIGRSHRVIRHPDMKNAFFAELWQTLLANKTWHGEIKSKTRNGGFFWSRSWIHPNYNDRGEKIGYTAIRHDITDKKQIEELAITDGLTQLYNRRHFDAILPKQLNIAKRHHECLAFAIMDIDHFKQYNDTYGHQQGDEALKAVAKAIQGCLRRAEDYAFRLGGEEFGIVFIPENCEKAEAFVQKIRLSVEALQIPHPKSSVSHVLTLSLGLVCRLADSIEHTDALYKEADTLLYASKQMGRNRVSCSAPTNEQA
jgi:diguanylate cyclase (GGDEF)-like protein/PAS domain S-box-containing protein